MIPDPAPPSNRAVATNSHALPVIHLREVMNVITCNRRSQQNSLFADESLLLGKRLCKIAHIRGRSKKQGLAWVL